MSKSIKTGAFIKALLNFLLIYFFPNRKKRIQDSGFSVPTSIPDLESMLDDGCLYYISSPTFHVSGEFNVDEFADTKRNLKISDQFFKLVDKRKKDWDSVSWFNDSWDPAFNAVYHALVNSDSKIISVFTVLGVAIDHAIKSCYRMDDVVIKGPPRSSILHKLSGCSFILWRFHVYYDEKTSRMVNSAESTLCDFDFVTNSFSSTPMNFEVVVSERYYASKEFSSILKTVDELAQEAQDEMELENAKRHLHYQYFDGVLIPKDIGDIISHSDDEIDL